MKKRLISLILAMAMTFGLVACGSTGDAETDKEVDNTEDVSDVEKPEVDKIVWAQANSGNVLVSIAKQQGYFEELGLNVEEVPLDDGQLEAVLTGQIDIASNSGTWTPVKMIAAGDDMAIIGGFMLTGCMPVIAAEGTEWNGPEDFLGKTIAASKSQYYLFNDLLEAGYDLDTDLTLVEMEDDTAEIAAVQKGELDYAVLGTNKNYQATHTEGIEIVVYCSDIMPNYSCCRMVARDSWVQENPITVKLLNTALIRAKAYFESHREECVDLMVEELGANKEFVEAFMLNEHYNINPDPVRNTVLFAYDYAEKVGALENKDETVNFEDRIYVDLYKEALDLAVEKYRSEDPEFYDYMVEFFEENNL